MPYADKAKQKAAVAKWVKEHPESVQKSAEKYRKSSKGKERDARCRDKNRHKIRDADNERRFRWRQRANARIKTANFSRFIGTSYELENVQFKFCYQGKVKWDNLHEKFPVKTLDKEK